MLLVVLGAGASYDSIPSLPPGTAGNFEEYRPPLAHGLFSRPSFVNLLGDYTSVRAIIPHLQDLGDGVALEQEIERLASEASEYPKRHEQLAALRFYLLDIISYCDQPWMTMLNTSAIEMLLDEVMRWRPKEDILIVTFNYDRLVERSLAWMGIQFDSLGEYISRHPIKLFKMHGSVDWARPTDLDVGSLPSADVSYVRYELIRRASVIKPISEIVRTPGKMGALFEGRAMMPALTIPTTAKQEFEIPVAHLQQLAARLPDVDAVLTIGWRGAEQHFMKLLRAHLRGKVRAMSVCASQAEAEEVLHLLNTAAPAIEGAGAFGSGFTSFLKRRAIVPLIRERSVL